MKDRMKTIVGFFLSTSLAISLVADYTSELWLLKTDSTGDTLWSRTYSAGRENYGVCIKETKEGGYIILGSSAFESSSKVWLLKMDSLGDTLWTRFYGGYFLDSPGWMEETRDGGYILTGDIRTELEGALTVLKTDSYGRLDWEKSYGDSSYYGWSTCVRQTLDNCYIVMGKMIRKSNNTNEDAMFKINDNGDSLWMCRYNNSSSETLLGMRMNPTGEATRDGGYIIAGNLGVDDTIRRWVIKTNAKGKILWRHDFTDSSWWSSMPVVIQELPGGDYIFGTGTSSDKTRLVRFSRDGKIRWSRDYDWGIEDLRPVSNDGFITLAWRGPSTCDRCYLIKINSRGDVEWTKPFYERNPDGPGIRTEGNTLELTSDGGYIIVGQKRYFTP